MHLDKVYCNRQGKEGRPRREKGTWRQPGPWCPDAWAACRDIRLQQLRSLCESGGGRPPPGVYITFMELDGVSMSPMTGGQLCDVLPIVQRRQRVFKEGREGRS